MGDSVRGEGIAKARRTLADLAARLRAAASGQVVDRAAQAIRAQVEKVATKYVEAHKESGLSESTLEVTQDGPLILLRSQRYLSYHAWWPFRSGMPPFVVSRANKIFAAELEAAISGKASPLLEMDAEAEARAAAKAAKVAKRVERKRIAAEKKAARETKRAATAERKRLAQEKRDRAHDERVRAREDRE